MRSGCWPLAAKEARLAAAWAGVPAGRRCPGAEPYRDSLDAFARAGGAPNPNGGELAHYEVAAEGGVEALTATFVEITRTVFSRCEIPLPPERTIDDPNKVNVAIDGWVLPKIGNEDGSGWDYIFDPDDVVRAIQITGPACERIQREGVERTDLIFECNVILA